MFLMILENGDKMGKGSETRLPTPAFNNRVCDVPIFVSDVGVAPCACSIIKIKIDLSRHAAQTHNVTFKAN
jgi:hypothetical protein